MKEHEEQMARVGRQPDPAVALPRRPVCPDHATHAAFLGHVADYCPECGEPFDPDPDDPACAR